MPIIKNTLVPLVTALADRGCSLTLVVSRQSDSELISVNAIEQSFKKNKAFSLIRAYQTDDGGIVSHFLVNKGEFYFRKVAAARDPHSFGNSTAAQHADAAKMHGLNPGVLELGFVRACGVTGSNLLTAPLDNAAATFSQAIKECQLLEQSLCGP